MWLTLLALLSVSTTNAQSYDEPTTFATVGKVQKFNATKPEADYLGIEYAVPIDYLLPDDIDGLVDADALSALAKDYADNHHRLPADPRFADQDLRTSVSFPKHIFPRPPAESDIVILFDAFIWIFDESGDPLYVFVNDESGYVTKTTEVTANHARAIDCRAEPCDEATVFLGSETFALKMNQIEDSSSSDIASVRLLHSVSLKNGSKRISYMTIHRKAVAETGPFSDVPHDHPYARDIDHSKRSGFVQGYPDGTFRPDEGVNRAELVKMIVEATGKSAQASACSHVQGSTVLFADLQAGAWYNPYVCAAKLSGIINGYPDGTFRPQQQVTLAEAAKILAIAYEISVTKARGEEWYAPYHRALAEAGALPPSIVRYEQPLTRAELAYILRILAP